MMPQIYDAIDSAISSGIAPQYIGAALIEQGWPPGMVNEAINSYLLSSRGRLQHKTDFRTWLKKYKRRARPATALIVCFSVLSSSILLLQPWPIKILVDSGFGRITAPGPLAPYTHTPTMILITSVMTIMIFLLKILFGTLRDYLVLRLGFGLNRNIKEESFRHILHLPLFHQERLAKGDYIYRQNTLTNSLSDLVLDTTSQIVQSVIMIIGILFIMLKFNFGLTIISVILIPFLFLLIKIFGPKLGRISRRMTKIASQTSSVVTESIDNAETLQAFTLEEKQINKANDLWWQTYYLALSQLMWGRLYRFLNSLLIILGTSLVMYLGGSAALHGQMTLGELLIYMTYMGYLLSPVETLATEIAARNQKLVDVSRVYEVLTDHEGIESLRADRPFPIREGSIEFQDVSYIASGVQILKNVNLKVEPGEKVAIIGPSGSGKTSMLKMIPMFIEPTYGRVLIDGADIQAISLGDLRHNIVWISQTPQLFAGSVLDNLKDGDTRRPITMDEVDNAITAANVKEFAEHLPMGLSSPVGEGGNSLSGGQKQRVAIARGLIKNAPIVCMDEPTAALDSKSETTIRDSISKLIAGKTVLMVTHRKALLSLMDKIYVMDDGQLHDIKHYGGLDSYLQKISDTEATQQKQTEERIRRETQAVLTRLEAEKNELEAQKEQLQEQIGEISQVQVEAGADSGTIKIVHR